ncbi:MAG TPA: glycerophosphodiester phosphodiesterase [Dehalococcoidia bacterium]|nr:glycerophosphodiester phosphodiesterase [Dehalococcoidia bacterium]
MTPLIIAHRTCPLDAPENSLAGMRLAAELGADAIEIDLRLSLDQRPFLMHDWTMKRTAGWPLPLELTPSPLVRKQRLADGSSVPSLDEAFEALSPAQMLAVDVKSPWAVLPLMRQIKRRALEKRVLVWCTSALAVRYAVHAAPQVEVAYLRDLTDPAANRAFIAKAQRLGARAISADWRAIDAQFIAAANARGLRVYSFDKGQDLAPEKLTSGLAGLITDRIAEARSAVKNFG